MAGLEPALPLGGLPYTCTVLLHIFQATRGLRFYPSRSFATRRSNGLWNSSLRAYFVSEPDGLEPPYLFPLYTGNSSSNCWRGEVVHTPCHFLYSSKKLPFVRSFRLPSIFLVSEVSVEQWASEPPVRSGLCRLSGCHTNLTPAGRCV